MKFAIVDNGIVINKVEADKEFGNSVGWIECPANIGIGCSFSNGVFIKANDTKKEEEIVDELRSVRNDKLTQSDWTQVADAPVDKAAWAVYRQALRDITAHPNFPNLNGADWPATPE